MDGETFNFYSNEFHAEAELRSACAVEEKLRSNKAKSFAEADSTHVLAGKTPPDSPYKIGKVRKARTTFTRAQVEALENKFLESTFISRDERQKLGKELGLTAKQVMVWFQNRRGRLKRRGKQDAAYSEDKLNEVVCQKPFEVRPLHQIAPWFHQTPQAPVVPYSYVHPDCQFTSPFALSTRSDYVPQNLLEHRAAYSPY
ncbi:DgyrCDS6457 [Dimorphilus gyrociliatus]|uniref:DgyrCDS6457 n=1 Tax=Dimorphilus gyrociliatus TaxID=2664684 RepID=A0A7I8VN44_9ANNE|nr:DgyrCDS6457 [Dimorphilus gyrociliatus]